MVQTGCPHAKLFKVKSGDFTDKMSRFLWAHIQLERICGLRTDRDIKSALRTLPSGLDGTFIRILETIQAKTPEAVQDIKKIFQWVIGSFRPLSLEAISEAISIQPEDLALDQDGIANDLEDVVAICRSLITMDRGGDSTRIALAHLSIEEFLRSDRIKKSSVAVFHMDSASIHFQLAKTCIQYLSFSDFEKPSFARDLDSRYAKYKLLTYASQHWIKHLKASNMNRKTFEDQLLPWLRWFLDPAPNSLHFYSWTQIFHCELPRLRSGYGTMQRVPTQPAVFYALLYGIDLLLDIIFPIGANVYQCFWDGMTPLHIAVYAGHFTNTKRLLESGASVKARTDYKNLAPLHIAAEQGHAQIVKLLLEYGADPHARSRVGTTPFYRSPRGGSLEVLDMLRMHGSDVNVHTQDGWTTLHEAVEADQLSFVERLVGWGVELNIRNGHGDTPLDYARELHRWDIVNLLKIQVSMNIMECD